MEEIAPITEAQQPSLLDQLINDTVSRFSAQEIYPSEHDDVKMDRYYTLADAVTDVLKNALQPNEEGAIDIAKELMRSTSLSLAETDIDVAIGEQDYDNFDTIFSKVANVISHNIITDETFVRRPDIQKEDHRRYVANNNLEADRHKST